MNADCEFCPDGHEDPAHRPWSVWVSDIRDGDGQPAQLVVGKTGCQHVSEGDAEWLRHVIRDARDRGVEVPRSLHFPEWSRTRFRLHEAQMTARYLRRELEKAQREAAADRAALEQLQTLHPNPEVRWAARRARGDAASAPTKETS